MSVVTDASNKILNMLKGADGKLQKMGEEPFMIVKATKQEQQERYNSLTPEKLTELINKHGYNEVNRWMKSHGGE